MIVERISHEKFYEFPPTVAMIGLFDGFHMGHRMLADKTLKLARQRDIESAVLTFDPDPGTILSKRPDGKITYLEERIQIAERLGFDRFYICTFVPEFAALEIDEFHKFVYDLNVQALVCGFDFTYGDKGSGNAKTLKEQEYFDVFEIDCFKERGEKISSTRIKQLIRSGALKEAGRLLGYFYSLPGKVASGFQRGSRLLGFPTANLACKTGYIIPRNGVYGGYVLLGDTAYPAMINIGFNPTFKNKEQTIEANLFNFDQDIYGKEIRIFFLFRLRDEKSFEGIDGLISQLKTDRRRVKQYLKNMEPQWSESCRLWRINRSFAIIESD